jgi:hypothetical protein
MVAKEDDRVVEESVRRAIMTAIVTHSTPAWGTQANFIIRVDLDDSGMSAGTEQLWARRIDQLTFEVCCIPFFAYGLALGDTVECSADFTIQRRLYCGGHRTLRIAISDFAKQHEIHEALHGWVLGTGMLHEWYSQGYLAVDVPPSLQSNLDTSKLDEMCRGNLIEIEFSD